MRSHPGTPSHSDPPVGWLAFGALMAGLVGCGDAPTGSASKEGPFAKGFASPEDCKSCHPAHYAQWRVSNHAYALEDPVFRAMVALGQSDTEGELGDFCVECHAPVASRTGQSEVTQDDAGVYRQDLGFDARARHGISCDVCHTLTKVGSVRTNADFDTVTDGMRRASISDPEPNDFHDSEFGMQFGESDMCGPCHNVFNEFFSEPVRLESTFREWRVSRFNGSKSCQDCHMPESQGPAAVGGPDRAIHDHTMVGVDVSLLPPKDFPGYDELRQATTELLRGAADWTAAWDAASARFTLRIENLAGHSLPSGATADREMWVELRVRDAEGKVAFESGTLDARGDLKQASDETTLEPGADPQLALFRQRMLFDPALEGKSGEVHDVHFLWEPNSIDENLIAATGTASVEYDLSTLRPGQYEVRARLLFRSFPPYLLRKLVDLGLLDPKVPDRVPTVEMKKLSQTIRVR